MEENKDNKKLTYEQLENAAKQISVQAEAMYKENMQLKQSLQQATMANVYTELNFRFKVLEYKDFFSKEFVDTCVKIIETTMTPAPEEEEKEEPAENPTKE